MAGKPQVGRRTQIAQIASSNASYRRLANGRVVWSHTPPPLEMVKDQRIKWRPIWCAGFEVDGQGEKHYHHLECLPCHCPPGPQIQATQCGCDEIALNGTRGSAKSESTFAFLTRGNVRQDLFTGKVNYESETATPIDISYLNAADYSFLVLRRNSKDLISYFKRASKYFALFGGEMTQEPMGVKFPSGAYGIFDHLADDSAYEKYVGQEFTRIVVEEANQIPDEPRYEKVLMSCRTSNPQMRSQTMLTFNPGGPGARWIKSRFIMPGGMRLPYGRPYKDPFSGMTRIVIFSSVEDNPYLMAQGYDKKLDQLKATNPTLYRQWRLGDIDAVAGMFFEMFRLQPHPDEPANACHVVKPFDLDGSYPRSISCDWGYAHPAAVYWGAWHPKKQLHVYREFVTNRMSTVELGAEIAKRSLDDLQKLTNPHITLYLSHDAFARESEKATEAEGIAQGIEKILGKGAAFIFDRTEEERLLDHDPSWESVKARAAKRRKNTYITIANAGMKRRGNLNKIRDYMRWASIEGPVAEFNEKIYRNLIERADYAAAYQYREGCKPKMDEYLPVLQIHYDENAPDPRDRGCEKLVAAIQAMVEKETDSEQMEKVDGDDPVDSLAYLVGNFQFSSGYIPEEEVIRSKVAAIRAMNPGADLNGIIMSARRIEHKAKSGSELMKGFVIPRVTGPTRRRYQAGVN